MPPLRIVIRSPDPVTHAEIMRELEQLRGHEPQGARLMDDAAPGLRAMDPQLAVVALALVSGIASGAGKKLGEAAIAWLLGGVRKIAAKRRSAVTVTVAGVEVVVDAQNDPEELVAHVLAALD